MERLIGVLGAIVLISAVILFGCSAPSEDSGPLPELGRSGDFLIINGNAINIYSLVYIKTRKIVGAYQTNVWMHDRNFYKYTGSRENCERVRDEIIALLAHPQ